MTDQVDAGSAVTETDVVETAPVEVSSTILGDVSASSVATEVETSPPSDGSVIDDKAASKTPTQAETVDAEPAQDAEEVAESGENASSETEEYTPITFDPFKLPGDAEFKPEEAADFLGVLEKTAKSYGLTKDQAQELGQELITLHASRIGTLIESIQAQAVAGIEQATQRAQDAIAEDHASRVDQWAKDFESDQDYGGKRRETSLNNAKSFIKAFTTPEDAKELSDALNSTGLGNHPAMIRLMARAGEAVNNAAKAIPGSTASSKPDVLTGMYGPSSKTK